MAALAIFCERTRWTRNIVAINWQHENPATTPAFYQLNNCRSNMQRRQATLKNKHPQLLAHADITCACSLFMQFTVVHVHGSEAKTRKGKEPNAFVTFLRVTAILSKFRWHRNENFIFFTFKSFFIRHHRTGKYITLPKLKDNWNIFKWLTRVHCKLSVGTLASR